MSLGRVFENELGEYLKNNHPDFERKWSTILDRLEQDASPTVKTIFDPRQCPHCGYPLE